MWIQIELLILIVILINVGGYHIPTNNVYCTVSGSECPYLPCCFEDYKCKLIRRNVYDENHKLVERQSEYKCLTLIRLGGPCSHDVECMHVKHARCINWKCHCQWNTVGINGTECDLVKML